MSRWLAVCAVDDIPRRGSRVVERASGPPIALIRTATDRVFAIVDRCPHRGGPLSQGLVTGERVVCPLHGWVIELAAGSAVAPDDGCTPTFAVEIRDGRVHLDAEAVTTAVVPAHAGTQCLSRCES